MTAARGVPFPVGHLAAIRRAHHDVPDQQRWKISPIMSYQLSPVNHSFSRRVTHTSPFRACMTFAHSLFSQSALQTEQLRTALQSLLHEVL
jgi:hypothetical protein